MIEVRELTKRYAAVTAVDSLSFDAPSGVVTGFLGPNGSGKSTTLRMVLGLERPDHGTARIDGRAIADFAAPLRHVGAALDARAFHPGRSARNHLLALAAATGLPKRRVDEVLETVGLADAARRRAGTYSLGMGQRLGLAAALLGDPGTLVLDEPTNGLDPQGIAWMRALLGRLAAEGRTVLVSSHQLEEIAKFAEQVVVINMGRLVADTTTAELSASSSLEDAVLELTDSRKVQS